jgi:hypothetical protein
VRGSCTEACFSAWQTATWQSIRVPDADFVVLALRAAFATEPIGQGARSDDARHGARHAEQRLQHGHRSVAGDKKQATDEVQIENAQSIRGKRLL